MIVKEVVVKNGLGFYVRLVILLVKKVLLFKFDVSIEYNGKKVNVKSLIGVLFLVVIKDVIIKVVVLGDDEVLVVEEIVKLVESLED